MQTASTTFANIDASGQPVVVTEHDSVIELSDRVQFNMHDAYYEHATVEHFWIQWRFETLQKLLLGMNLGDNVFEVGCGNGVVQQQFEGAFDITIDGCDLNYDAMVNGLPTRGQKYLYNVYDQREQWEKHFDSVLLLDTLEHIEHPKEFLVAVGNHLTDEGLLIINVPALPWLYSRYDSVQGHVGRYTVDQLQTELQSAGFEIARHQYWGGNVLPIALLRKLMVMFARDDQVLTTGFAPPGRFAESILRSLMKLETSEIKLLPYGTSLAAIARKTRGSNQ